MATLPSLVSALRRLAALGLLVTAAAACGSRSGEAAVVDGRTITHDDVVAELEAIRGNEDYLRAYELAGATVLGETEGAFDAAFVATQLGVRIQYAIVGAEVDRRGIEPDDACRAAARRDVERNLAPVTPDGDGAALLDGFPARYRDHLVDRQADLLALQGDLVGIPCLTDEALAEHVAEDPARYEQACASHILVETEEEAEAVVAELRAGADFAGLAAERSTDRASAQDGGSIGCFRRGDTVAAFDEAAFSLPVGEVSDPVETEFGFHVIRVDSREAPDLDGATGEERAAILDEVRQVVLGEVRRAFAEWYREAVAAAEVRVDPRYGRWDPETGTVERPAGGRPAFEG